MSDKRVFLFQVLASLVESVKEQPRRILFRGVSGWFEDFKIWSEGKHKSWNIQVTGGDTDIVGSRNDSEIDTLVIFYRNEVRERESLNAFRIFDENIIVDALVQVGQQEKILPEVYSIEEMERLRALLRMVYPSIDNLLDFLLSGKAQLGEALPLIGLFHDPRLEYSTEKQQWNSRLTDNYEAASIRWHDFIDRVIRSRETRKFLGQERATLVIGSEAEPEKRVDVLRQVSFDEALQVLNPPTDLETRLMQAGMKRDDSAELVRKVKNGEVNPEMLPPGLPSLPEIVIQMLKLKKPDKDNGEGNGTEVEVQRANSCLEALLRLGQSERQFPRKIRICREKVELAAAEISFENGCMVVQLSSENARALSTPASGAGEIVFQIIDPENSNEVQSTFSILNHNNKLESYSEWWPDEIFWDQLRKFAPNQPEVWETLRKKTQALREIIDPDWKNEPEDNAAEPTREPNNQIYQIFDLIYLANRPTFEEFLNAWLEAARLPWRLGPADLSTGKAVASGLLKFGLGCHDGQDSLAVLPYYPLRLVWYRAVIHQVETWLIKAIGENNRLLFEPSILADQLASIDRPHAIFLDHEKRYLESSRTPFFSLFVPDSRRRRIRAPLDRARQKVEQFGRMWPFSLSRLHLAFQPGDASDDIYSLLVQQAEAQHEAAYHVRALLENTGMLTVFDQQLFNTGEETTDLLTQEYHESMRPRVDYFKDTQNSDNPDKAYQPVHIALLVDAFREDLYGFEYAVGKLSNPRWMEFNRWISSNEPQALDELKQVDLSAPSYHVGQYENQQRDIVYVPFNGDRPEYMRLIYDSLAAWVRKDAFSQAVYFERVKWDEGALRRLHDQADWVILFDRTLDRAFFKKRLDPAGIKLIDFYPRLPGGYRLSISSSRIAEVEWQMTQVLNKIFSPEELDLKKTAGNIINALGEFASGLLLKTLGGGSLAQELLGLYATYLSLIKEGEYVQGKDWLIPLDNYQEWFGRRKQSGRRADLLVLRNPYPDTLELLAVESKWYKRTLDNAFVADEFGSDGQIRTAIRSLSDLFNPQQFRLDKDYWQRTLKSLLNEAPSSWNTFRDLASTGNWKLHVDGIVYVHQYREPNPVNLAERIKILNIEASKYINTDSGKFHHGLDFQRLRLLSRPEIIDLFKN